MKLSIIIPTREEGKAIVNTIDQFKNTLTISHEVIVSDGGSIDKTVEVARSAGARVVEFDKSRPHNAAIGRNDGARIAEGEFLCFIDADVRIPNPDAFFTRALSYFEDARIVGVCGAQRAEPAVETWADRLSFGWLNFVTWLQNNILHIGVASGKILILRRSTFDELRGFRETLVAGEDLDVFKRVSKKGRTVFDYSLMIYHGARRAHKIGWTRLWLIWTPNIIHVAVFDRAHAKDWTPIR